MHKVNELLGRDVLGQDTGKKRGTVKNLLFDEATTRVIALVVDGGGFFGGTKTVRWEYVLNVGDVVMLAGGALILAGVYLGVLAPGATAGSM